MVRGYAPEGGIRLSQIEVVEQLLLPDTGYVNYISRVHTKRRTREHNLGVSRPSDDKHHHDLRTPRPSPKPDCLIWKHAIRSAIVVDSTAVA